ncbi:hypothetical protein KK078_20690 [Fulvivirgaceae bacterium PWU37]|uniref:Uncharacterized protein n=1 Tax=Dawidia soli TaxID=2782352 RepID=A0AAP2DDY1_9BACT|nr:hypothetical protein [Dawidia soli]
MPVAHYGYMVPVVIVDGIVDSRTDIQDACGAGRRAEAKRMRTVFASEGIVCKREPFSGSRIGAADNNATDTQVAQLDKRRDRKNARVLNEREAIG